MHRSLEEQVLHNPARLAAVRALKTIDGQALETLRSIVRLTQRTLATPSAYISLVERDREFILAGHAESGQPHVPQETLIGHSIGRHVVVSGESLEIELLEIADGSRDAENPNAPGRHAGMAACLVSPLRCPGGYIVGSLAVVDGEPRHWSSRDHEDVNAFAQLAAEHLHRLLLAERSSPGTWLQLSGALDALRDAVVVAGQDRSILVWNQPAEELFGYTREQALGSPIVELIAADERDRIYSEIAAGVRREGRWAGQVPVARANGETAVVDVTWIALRDEDGNVVAHISINHDASERERLDAAMIQAQKLESLGSMAGGLAHDFNNLLSVILGSVSLLRLSDSHLTDDDAQNLDTVEQAARQAADITGRLLSFARGELSQLAEIDLRDVIRDALQLIRSNIPGQIDVRLDLPGDPVFVEGDAAQLQQALMNIVLNACYVMPDGGTLGLRLGTTAANASIAISDTGPGMDDATKARLFEPFFTTKPHGLGTGLGLPSAYGIVAGHRGRIDVESEPGKGATFIIRLPLLDRRTVERPPEMDTVPGGVVLVVDDDDIVRRATVSMVRRLGVHAESAASGAEAIEAIRADPAGWSAVVLDLVMPQMSGAEVLRALHAIRPGLPVLICTGYAPDQFLQDDDRRRVAAILHKPFTLDRLREALGAVGLVQPDRAAS